MNSKKLPLSLLIVLFAGSLAAYIIFPHTIKTDMLSLLPAVNAQTDKAFSHISKLSMGRVNVLIGSAEPELLESAVNYFKSLIPFETEEYDYNRLLEYLSCYNYRLLSDEDRALLKLGKKGALAERALAMIYSPIGITFLPLDKDPMNFFVNYLLSLNFTASAFQLSGGSLTTEFEGVGYIYLPLDLLKDYTFSSTELLHALNKVEEAKTLTLSAYPKLKINISGIPLHSAYTSSASAKEGVAITIFSFLIILAISIFVLRSLMVFPLSFTVIALAFAAAFFLTSALFGEIHVLTLLFGASLIGLSIDYILHFIVEFNSKDSASEAIATVRSAIISSFFTSAAGFAVIFVSALPLLKQMAFFSMVGLLSVFLAVLSIYPLIYSKVKREKKPFSSYSINNFLLKLTDIWRGRLIAFFTRGRLKPLVVLPLITLGICGLQKNNSLHDIYTPDRKLLEAEVFFSRVIGVQSRPAFIFVAGAHSESALQREEELRPILEQLKANGGISGYRAVSQIIPSLKRQREDYAFIAQLLPGEVEILQSALQFDAAVTERIMTYFNEQAERYIYPKDIALLDSLILEGEGTIISLEGVVDWERLKALENEVYFLIDRVGGLNAMLEKYWSNAILINLAAFLAVSIFLALRYRVRKAAYIILPPTIAIITLLALFGYIGVNLSFFHIAAIFLVLAFGIDYAIFQAEDIQSDTAGIAVLYSCITTLSSFGMLAFTSFEIARAFGATLFIGVLLAYLFSPLATLAKRQ
ncbi:MAG: MMPL family transporter [Deferribacteraceae bacterium]|nr:MMPL family transporter [Deferribacteraceae bacterium]